MSTVERKWIPNNGLPCQSHTLRQPQPLNLATMSNRPGLYPIPALTLLEMNNQFSRFAKWSITPSCIFLPKHLATVKSDIHF